jgi:hypothetical protein
MEDPVAADGVERRSHIFRSPDAPRAAAAFDRRRNGVVVSDERRRLGWAVTLTGAAVMAAGAALMALSSF